MPWKLTIRAAELLVTAVLAAALFAAWRAERNDRTQLSAELATAKQSLTQADDRQHTRDSQLLQTLATLAADKRTITTPAQIIRELPQQLGLPLPITLQPTTEKSADTRPDLPAPKPGSLPNQGSSNANSSKAEPQQTQAVIPTADLKPLYDFTIDCKTCHHPGQPDRRENQNHNSDQATR